MNKLLKQSELLKLTEAQSRLTENISQMSLSLLDLQNQVQILKIKTHAF